MEAALTSSKLPESLRFLDRSGAGVEKASKERMNFLLIWQVVTLTISWKNKRDMSICTYLGFVDLVHVCGFHETLWVQAF